MRISGALAILVVPTLALGQVKPQPPVTIIHLEGGSYDGSRHGPSELIVDTLRNPKAHQLIRFRDNFRARVLESAQELH